MPAERNYARLGLFMVVALAVFLATALLFVQRARSRAVIEMVTYTRENVSGIDVSSPVRYRGVPLGRVTEVSDSFITVEIADGVRIKVQRQQITQLVPKGTYKSA